MPFDFYDPIGNRTSATDYDEQGNPLVSSYSANALNQYTQRTVPGYAAVRGEAATNATVTINERPTFRQGSFFYGGDDAENTASAVYKDLEVYAAINPSGTNTPDIVSAATGTVFIAKTPEQFTYDADGNMTSDGRFHYFWNGENRLVCASNADVVVTYAYDHRGRMVTKNLCSSAPLRLIKSTTYIWDDWNIIREVVREGDSVAVTDNIWGLDIDGTLQGAGGVGGLLAVVRDDGVFFPTYDANGNVSEYVSTNGEVVAHYDYSPFGEPLVASGLLAATFTHQFSTKPYCPVTGFSEYQMRKYMPEIGRWMSRDPIGEKEGLNLLTFLNNSQIYYDKLGESISLAACNTAVKGAVQYNSKVKLLLEKIKAKGCHKPNITCACCTTSAGCFDPVTKDITVCADQSPDQGYVIETVAHELVHAYDDCTGTNWQRCEERACSEIRAYDYEGSCRPGGTFRQPGESYKECIKRKAAGSVSTDSACGDGRSSVEAVFLRCFGNKIQ